MAIQQHTTQHTTSLAQAAHFSRLSPYPIDPSFLPILPNSTLDVAGVPYDISVAGYHPTTIAQFALAHWNEYVITHTDHHRRAFLTQAYWLLVHEIRIGDDASGWPIPFSCPEFHATGPWLSALTQGNAISVLTRAYQLTREEIFLQVAQRAVRTFEHDILDGGVSTPLGPAGIFFEEVAVYPAAHILSGFLFALLGLYDYVALTSDSQVQKLIHHSLATMHRYLDEFDLGFWTRSDLLQRTLSTPSQLALQSMLLQALARYSGCDHCAALASRWQGYQLSLASRLRYALTSRYNAYKHTLLKRVQHRLFPTTQAAACTRVCVPLPSFPVMGGVLTVLEGIAQVTKERWQFEYLTQHLGPDRENFVIHQFGNSKTRPWHFPLVMLYSVAGFCKLIALMRRGANYQIILPQDSVYTGAFAALAGKLAGVRVVCIDHAHLTVLTSRIYSAYRTERITALARKRWHWAVRLLVRLLFELYRPALYLLARISARCTDHFLVPGVAGDGVEDICKRLGVPQSRITRFASMINIERHIVPDAAAKATLRAKNGIASDDIVIAIVCRLAPEKGLDIALESIDRTLAALSPDLHRRIRILIVGDGPLRKHIEDSIRMRGLSENCILWGEASPTEVLSLLGISDIFLYTSTRGACFAMAVLEAMASSCAVIAATEPMSNAQLLAEGRGIAVPAGNVEQTTQALMQLVNDPLLCRRMGSLARDYIAVHHSPAMFRRDLMRVTYWSGLDELSQ